MKKILGIPIIPTTLALIAITALVYALGFYTTDGSGVIATSPFSTEVIIDTMNNTEHIRHIETIGITPEGKTFFLYRWEDYGFSNIFSVMSEEKEVKEKLDIVDIKR